MAPTWKPWRFPPRRRRSTPLPPRCRHHFRAPHVGSPDCSGGSGVINLSLLNAGVGSSGAVGLGTGPSVGGQRPRNNNFTIEGIDNNSGSVTGPLVTLPNDAVAEFSVQQNQISPEFGHSSGGQFNQVVKSGGNELHGTAYEYLQNRNLNAGRQSVVGEGDVTCILATTTTASAVRWAGPSGRTRCSSTVSTNTTRSATVLPPASSMRRPRPAGIRFPPSLPSRASTRPASTS